MSSCRSLLVALLLNITLFLALVQAECFYPDGTSDADGFPCNTTAGAVTHCCRTFEACLDKGICYTQWDSQFYRRSCTDKSWGDGCPTVCTDVEPSSPNGILACSQGTDPTYCCGNGSASCCSPSNEFNFIPGEFLGVLDASGSLCPPLPVATTITRTSTLNAARSTTTPAATSSSTQSTSASPISSEGATSSQTLTPSPSSDSSSASRTVGLAVGIPLGVLLLASIAGLFFFFNRRLNQEKEERRKLEQKLTPSSDPSGPGLPEHNIWEKGGPDVSQGGLTGVAEIGTTLTTNGRHEMGLGKSTYEVGSSSSGTRV